MPDSTPIVQLCEELATSIIAAGIPASRDICPDIKFEDIETLTGIVTPYSIKTRRHTRADERHNELKLVVFIVSPAKKRDLPDFIARVDQLVSALLASDLPSAKIMEIELDPIDDERFFEDSLYKATLGVTLQYISDRM